MDPKTEKAIKAFVWKLSSRFEDREEAFLAGYAAASEDKYEQWVVTRVNKAGNEYILGFGQGSAAESRANAAATAKGGKVEFKTTEPPWVVRIRRARDAMFDRRGLPEVSEADLATVDDEDDSLTSVIDEILGMSDQDLEAEFIAQQTRDEALDEAYKRWWTAMVLVEEKTGDPKLDAHNKAELERIEALFEAYEEEVMRPPEPSEPEPMFAGATEVASVIGANVEGVVAQVGDHTFNNGWSVKGLGLGGKRKQVLDACLESADPEAMDLYFLLKDGTRVPFDWDEEYDDGYCGLHDARKDDSQRPRRYVITVPKSKDGSLVLGPDGQPIMEQQIVFGPHFVLGKQRNLWTTPVTESDRLDIRRFNATDDHGQVIRIKATGRAWQPAWRAFRASILTKDYFTVRRTLEQIMAHVAPRDEFELVDVVGMLSSYASKEHTDFRTGEIMPPVGEREDVVEVTLRVLEGTSIWAKMFGKWYASDMLEELGVCEPDGPFATTEDMVGSKDNGWGWMIPRLFGSEWDTEEEQPFEWGEFISVAEALQGITDRYQASFVDAMVNGGYDWLQCQEIAARAWKAGLPKFANPSDARAVDYFRGRKVVAVPPAEKLAIGKLVPSGLVIEGELWPWDVCMAKLPRLALDEGMRKRLIAALPKCQNRGADEFRTRIGG